MERVIYTGAQGTGKTTILNIMRATYDVITEVVRNLAKTGIKINEQGTLEGQETIFNEYKRLLSEKREYISDRGLTDVAAYTLYHSVHEKNIDKKAALTRLALDQINYIKQFVKENPDVVYCYFPIEFPVVDDGVRSTDEKFREEIDKHIVDILKIANIPYITITGSVATRLSTCMDAMEYAKYRNILYRF